MPEPTDKNPVDEVQADGVWIVADDVSGSDYVAVFRAELDALRFVNSSENFGNYRARYLPYGTWLHDLNYPPRDVPLASAGQSKPMGPRPRLSGGTEVAE